MQWRLWPYAMGATDLELELVDWLLLGVALCHERRAERRKILPRTHGAAAVRLRPVTGLLRRGAGRHSPAAAHRGGVDSRAHDNVHGLLAELEGVDRLELVGHGGGDADDERRLGGAADRVGEEPRELALSEGRPFLLARGEDLDAAAEDGQALVDGLGLVEGAPLDARLLDALGAGEVDEVELAW